MKLRQIFIENTGSQNGKSWIESHLHSTCKDKVQKIEGSDETGYTITMGTTGLASTLVLNVGEGTSVEIPYKINKVNGNLSIFGNLSSLKNIPNEISGNCTLEKPISSISGYKIKCKKFTTPVSKVFSLKGCLIETQEGIVLRDVGKIEIDPSYSEILYLGESTDTIEIQGDLVHNNMKKIVFYKIADPSLLKIDAVNLVCYKPGFLNITQKNCFDAQKAIKDKQDGLFDLSNVDLARSFHRHEGKGTEGAFDLVDELFNQGFKNFL